MRDYSIRVILGLILMVAIGATAWGGTIKGHVTAKKAKELSSAVVYIDSMPGNFPPPKEHALMDQKNLVYVPHILPILVGTTVDFRNSDDVAHNVFSPDESAGKFNLGTWPKGESRSYTFNKRCDKTCSAEMLCNVHPEMEAFVVIMQNPYYAQANDSGLFVIDSIPAGHYPLAVWHPKLKAETQYIDVPKEGTVNIDFALKK